MAVSYPGFVYSMYFYHRNYVISSKEENSNRSISKKQKHPPQKIFIFNENVQEELNNNIHPLSFLPLLPYPTHRPHP